MMEYIKRFRDIALDCYDHCEERTLVEMFMTNMIREYRAVLENLEISQFAQLLQKAKKTAQSVKPSTNKRSAPQAMAVSTSEQRKKTVWQCLLVSKEGRLRGGSTILPCQYHALQNS